MTAETMIGVKKGSSPSQLSKSLKPYFSVDQSADNIMILFQLFPSVPEVSESWI
jgi:hypothetical protein